MRCGDIETELFSYRDLHYLDVGASLSVVNGQAFAASARHNLDYPGDHTPFSEPYWVLPEDFDDSLLIFLIWVSRTLWYLSWLNVEAPLTH